MSERDILTFFCLAFQIILQLLSALLQPAYRLEFPEAWSAERFQRPCCL